MSLNLDRLSEDLESLVSDHLAGETLGRDSAHNLGHIRRVVAHARAISTDEGADVAVCIAAAWLHDLVYLPKNHPDASQCAERAAALIPAFAARVGLGHRAAEIAQCVAEHSFTMGTRASTLESAVLQDADRLDAMGAVGIARCFATGGSFGSALWHEADPFARTGRPLDDKAFALDHFGVKLGHLASGMNTAAGRARAAVREETMAAFLAALAVEVDVRP